MVEENQIETEQRTPLYERHLALGARMIPFAGWIMPVQYTGIIDEHRTVRSKAGLFDLGHMGQVDVSGPDALPYLQYVTTNDVSALGPGDAQYSLLPNEQGGVVDDIIVYRRPSGDGYMVCHQCVESSQRRVVDARPAERTSRADVEVTDISDATGMIAIQGPAAARLPSALRIVDLSDAGYFAWTEANVAGKPVMVARTGYTGEDGFEFFTKIDRRGRYLGRTDGGRRKRRTCPNRARRARHASTRSANAALR